MALDIRQMEEGNLSWDDLAKIVRAEKSFILYHGTTDLFLPQILRKGILPRSLTGNSVYEGREFGNVNLESRPHLAYVGSLRKAYSGAIEAVCKYGGKMVTLRCNVNANEIFSDEDVKAKTGLESLAVGGSCGIKRVPISRILGYSQEKEQMSEEWIYTILRNAPVITRTLGNAAFREFAEADLAIK